MHGHINDIAVSRTSVSPALLHWRTQLWIEAGWKTFAVVLQHCSEAKCLCIDLAERENREIFHMFISRTPQDKQPSLSLSFLLFKAQPAQVIKILPSQGEITLCLVAKVRSWKDSYSALSLCLVHRSPLSSLVYLSNISWWSFSLTEQIECKFCKCAEMCSLFPAALHLTDQLKTNLLQPQCEILTNAFLKTVSR